MGVGEAHKNQLGVPGSAASPARRSLSLLDPNASPPEDSNTSEQTLVESDRMESAPSADGEDHSPTPAGKPLDSAPEGAIGPVGPSGNNLLAALGLTRGEAAEVLHQHLMARRRRLLRPSGPASSAELGPVLRTYAARKAAFGELLRQGKLPPLSSDL